MYPFSINGNIIQVGAPTLSSYMHVSLGGWKQAGFSAKASVDIAGVSGGTHPCIPAKGNRYTNQRTKPATGLDALEVCY